jgi:hypothetical protein
MAKKKKIDFDRGAYSSVDTKKAGKKSEFIKMSRSTPGVTAAYAIKDVATGKRIGGSAYEDGRQGALRKARQFALEEKARVRKELAKDNKKANEQGAANKRYKETGNYGR